MVKQTTKLYAFGMTLALSLCGLWSLKTIHMHYQNHLERNAALSARTQVTASSAYPSDQLSGRFESSEACCLSKAASEASSSSMARSTRGSGSLE